MRSEEGIIITAPRGEEARTELPGGLFQLDDLRGLLVLCAAWVRSGCRAAGAGGRIAARGEGDVEGGRSLVILRLHGANRRFIGSACFCDNFNCDP